MPLFPSPVKRTMVDNKKEGGAYVALVSGSVLAWYLLSSGEFSFAMTMGSLTSLFSFVMLALSLPTTAGGVSVKMLQCYFVMQFFKCWAVCPFEGYLPFDASGDWFYQVVEMTQFGLIAYLLYALKRGAHKEEYQEQFDQFQILYLILPACVMSTIFHSHLNQDWFADIAWAFALNLESVAGLPQLFFFQREKKVHRWTAHFLVGQFVAKVMNTMFWLGTYAELNVEEHITRQFAGFWCLAVQGWQLLVMGDFFMQYAKCMSNGMDMSDILNEV